MRTSSSPIDPSTNGGPRKQGRRLMRVFGLALVALIAGGAAPAAADPIVLRFVPPHLELPDVRAPQECEPGDERVDIVSTNWAPRITHAKRYEHFTGGSGTYTKTATHRTTVTAGLTATLETSFKHSLVFAALQTKIGIEITAEGSKTSEESISVTETMNKNDAYIFYGGTISYHGDFEYFRCTTGSRWELTNDGEVHSWDVETEGAVACAQDVPANTLAARAKQYCGQADPQDVPDVVDALPSEIDLQWSRG